MSEKRPVLDPQDPRLQPGAYVHNGRRLYRVLPVREVTADIARRPIHLEDALGERVADEPDPVYLSISVPAGEILAPRSAWRLARSALADAKASRAALAA